MTKGDSPILERAASDLGAQFGAAVASLMHRESIARAPQIPLLRHGHQQSTSRLSRVEQLCQCTLILNKMFQHIKRAYDIKFAIKKNTSCIHLMQLNPRQTCFSKD